MTLTEALRALHKAGRIRSPWLPGMAFGGSDGWGYVGRVIDMDPDEPCEWEYKGYHYHLSDGAEWYESGSEPLSPPIPLTDPATVGCLLALLREASGDDHMTTQHPSYNTTDEDWRVWWGGGAGVAGQGPTEGEAIAAALIAWAAARREEG